MRTIREKTCKMAVIEKLGSEADQIDTRLENEIEKRGHKADFT